MKILLHLCCAPCSTYTVKAFRAEGHQLLGCFYNPHIHPFGEYLRRKAAMEDYGRRIGLRAIWPAREEMEVFFRKVAYHESGEERCGICYQIRLARTAERAREDGCDGFSTTLLISPHQKQDLLRNVGLEIAQQTGVPFYHRDLRPGWKWSRQEARQLGLYQQTYCGCLFSERERLLDKFEKTRKKN